MIIRFLLGKILLETSHKTVKASLEYAVEKGVDLSQADLRRARLSGASLDGIRAKQACFWGADLSGADMGAADLRSVDFRCADLSDTCFAKSRLTAANATGAYFSHTIFDECVMDGMRVSCPSFWGCNIETAASLFGISYSHQGESEIVFNKPPIVITGLGRRLVLAGDDCLWGNEHISSSRNTKKPIPKIFDKHGVT